MKKVILYVTVMIAVCATCKFLYRESYDARDVEIAFAQLQEQGFSKKLARRLAKQYERSDASYTLHFLATGYEVHVRNPDAFTGDAGEAWRRATAAIMSDGALAAETMDP
jgi:hypothetical protein